MSAGSFEVGRYEQDNAANIWECRVQPETKGLTLSAAANAYPVATATANLPTLEISKRSNRGFGVKPRTVTVRLTADGTGDTGDYLGTGTLFTIPVFTESVWDGYAKGQTGTYLGIACEFVNKSPESVR